MRLSLLNRQWAFVEWSGTSRALVHKAPRAGKLREQREVKKWDTASRTSLRAALGAVYEEQLGGSRCEAAITASPSGDAHNARIFVQ